jgi:hypothetical protein
MLVASLSFTEAYMCNEISAQFTTQLRTIKCRIEIVDNLDYFSGTEDIINSILCQKTGPRTCLLNAFHSRRLPKSDNQMSFCGEFKSRNVHSRTIAFYPIWVDTTPHLLFQPCSYNPNFT